MLNGTPLSVSSTVALRPGSLARCKRQTPHAPQKRWRLSGSKRGLGHNHRTLRIVAAEAMREKVPVDFEGGGALGECLAVADADAAADGMVPRLALDVARWSFEGCGCALVSGRVTSCS